MISKFNPTTPWLVLYIFVNLIAAAIMLNTRELIGDVAGNPLGEITGLLKATSFVILSYIILLGPVFSVFSKIKVPKIGINMEERKVGERVGLLLVFLQLGFMVFNFMEGVNIAGSNNIRSDSMFSMFWVLIPVDTLFIIYYGVYRESNYFKYNLVIWLLSNIVRGWSGVFLLIIFFEWCQAIHRGKVSLLVIFFVGAAVLALYPFLLNLKWFIRSSGVLSIDLGGLMEALIGTVQEGYFSVFAHGLEQIISRLQVTSMVVEVMHLSDFLQNKFVQGDFAPFWMEGLHGIAYDRLFIGSKTVPIGVAFTEYADFNWKFEVGDWNTNIGYVGWFYIAPFLSGFYVLYTLLLSSLSVILVKLIGKSPLSMNMLWYIWLVYLLPPWFGAFVGFIYALVIFLFIKIIVSKLPSVRLIP